MAEEADIDAYFERIGFAGSIAPSLDTLGMLHQMHPAVIPFENLTPLMGAPVRLELKNLQQKLLFDRRGGYCIEHNLLFKAVLESLDFPVRAHAAEVLWGRGADEAELTGDKTHMVLTVDVNGASYLADVGFGGLTLTAPLRLRAETEQQTPHEVFRLLGGDPTWRLEVKLGEDDWRPLYAFDTTPVDLAALSDMSERVAHTPLFRDNLIAARAERTRRLALDNLRFTTRPLNGEPEVRILSGAAELREVLSGPFGISLPEDERLAAALEKIAPAHPADDVN